MLNPRFARVQKEDVPMKGNLAIDTARLKRALIRAVHLFLIATVTLLVGLVLGLRPAPRAMADAPAWTDLGIVYSPPNGGGAYYPSVIYDANGSGSGSPAVDTSSQTAAAASLSLHITCTDEQGDPGIVDLGYHHLALPDTLTPTADPSALIANGMSTTTLTATLY
jgi:hypothetical protein